MMWWYQPYSRSASSLSIFLLYHPPQFSLSSFSVSTRWPWVGHQVLFQNLQKRNTRPTRHHMMNSSWIIWHQLPSHQDLSASRLRMVSCSDTPWSRDIASSTSSIMSTWGRTSNSMISPYGWCNLSAPTYIREMWLPFPTGFSTFMSLPSCLFFSSFFCYMTNCIGAYRIIYSYALDHCREDRKASGHSSPIWQRYCYIFAHACISSLFCQMTNMTHTPDSPTYSG